MAWLPTPSPTVRRVQRSSSHDAETRPGKQLEYTNIQHTPRLKDPAQIQALPVCGGKKEKRRENKRIEERERGAEGPGGVGFVPLQVHGECWYILWC
jgi:hypothetical protein